ncbi:Cys-tRNA(Pro) deacylase [Fictibacillus aquaticus]|uniref:Cys-tRNA(Pro)/Cys-tRNA(Cys) deacylase n=1 Tax=Fictibacillus aquaticus TaxID=2021314 RepID=A0A235FDG0_9BACL|nr:Cys-tRNA(Pro) deacylase [Fictibacillus aquaticus]OYD59440.1 Cys-tRNA(Pro) deacylase [Fictibacillus aquaticus]
MKKTTKTNAMRILERNKVDYFMITYTSEDGKIDGVSVADKIGRNAEEVYKTLIAQSARKYHYVFVIPVEDELDLKKAAKAAGEKKVEMIPVKDITPITGYVRGGCSPIGMKKALPTFVHKNAQQLETIIVSGGQIGMQIELSPQDLLMAARASFADLTK